MITKMKEALWVLIVLLIITGCDNTSPTSTNILTEPVNEVQPSTSRTVEAVHIGNAKTPVAIVSLDNHTLNFTCLNESNFIQDIYLGDYALLNEPYHLGPVYYVNPSSIFVTLYSDAVFPWEHSIVNINPETGAISSIKIPEELGDAVRTIAHGRLVLAKSGGGMVWIISNDMNVIEVNVNSRIYRLIQIEGDKVAALNNRTIEENGNAFFEVFSIDITKGDFIKKVSPSLISKCPRIIGHLKKGQKFYVVQKASVRTL